MPIFSADTLGFAVAISEKLQLEFQFGKMYHVLPKVQSK